MDERLISRSEALDQGLMWYFTGKPCKNGHIDQRYVKNWTCASCIRDTLERTADYRREWMTANKDRVYDLNKSYRDADPIAWAEKNKRWRLANPDKCSNHRKASYYRHHERRKVGMVEWRKQNKAIVSALQAKRRAAVMQRTPAWLTPTDRVEINAIYAYCAALRQCGLDYHVDHIVPLRGKTVSGLHVPWNLQVIPALDNIRKGNR